MHCRAALLLDKEIEYLQLFPLHNISVNKVPDPFICLAKISGLKGSIWESGVFHLTVRISEHYNEEVPDIFFNTIPFHPNVDPNNGKLCIQFNNLLSELTLNNILLLVQNVLSNPILTDAVNSKSARLLTKKPQDYEKLVKKCIRESKNVVGVLASQEPLEDVGFNQRSAAIYEQKKVKPYLQSNITAAARAKQISFDIYHRTWTQVATTKPLATVTENDNDGMLLLKLWENEDRPASTSSLRLRRSVRPSQSKQKQLERVSAMKKLYMNKSTDVDDNHANTSDIKDEQYLPDDEANELVKWTTHLDEERI